jgi:hypothetical protein
MLIVRNGKLIINKVSSLRTSEKNILFLWNSKEFSVPEVPVAKILWNSASRRSREQKFFGIPFFVVSDVKNAQDFLFFIVGVKYIF